MAAHPTLRAHLTHTRAPLTYGVRMDPYQLPEDPTFEPPNPPDVVKVSQDQAVRMIEWVLTGRIEIAFGHDKEWWEERLFDWLCGNRTRILTGLISPYSYTSAWRQASEEMFKVIEQSANRLLAEMDTEELEHEGLAQ